MVDGGVRHVRTRAVSVVDTRREASMSTYRQFHIRRSESGFGWDATEEATGQVWVSGIDNPVTTGVTLVQTLTRKGVDTRTVQTEIHY